MKAPPIDLDIYPPFEGFSASCIEFLRKLKRNNNRPWFEKHRGEYEADVKLPMQSFISAIQPHFESFAPEFDVDPKRSLFRIYRDIRFSKDKTPYKTHVAAHFVLRGKSKGIEGSGYYMHIEPGGIFIGGGIYMPDSDQVKKIRLAISNQSEDFLLVVKNRAFVKRFKKFDGERLQRVPHGYDPSHPMAEYLMLKQFFVGVEWPERKCLKRTFVKEVATVFEDAAPLVDFLNKAMQ